MGISYYVPALSHAYHDAGGHVMVCVSHCMMSELFFYWTFNLLSFFKHFHALCLEIDPLINILVIFIDMSPMSLFELLHCL